MKGAAIHVAMLLVSVVHLVAAGGDAHPITKVIKMLQGLAAKTEMMGKVEAGSYSKFVGWCGEQTTTLKDAIEEEKAAISELGDTISGKTKEQKGLEVQIDALIEQITELEANAAKAKKVRADEAAVYKASVKDFRGTIKAVEDALVGLKKAGVESKKGLLFAQRQVKQALALVGAFTTAEDRDAIDAFLQENEVSQQPLLAKGNKAEALNKYDFKSGNVIGLMKAMKAKFEDEKSAAIKAETNSLNAYELTSQARESARTAATDSKAKKEAELGEVKKALSEAKGELRDQKDDKEADTTTLDKTDQSCRTKRDEWEKRSETRKLELEAMDTAIKILAKVTGVRTEAPNNPKAFLQLAALDVGTDPRLKAVNLLRETAKTEHSHALERLAAEISAHLDAPFDQVTNMVEKMIFRLMAEQTSEDKHKKWCDQELAQTKAMKDNKDDRIEELDVNLQAETAGVAQLTEEVKAADAMVSKIVASMKEATEIRALGKQENMEAIADAEKAQRAILGAIEVMEAFYKDSGMVKEEAFLEAPVDLPKSPSTWDAGYTGVADPTNQPGGIIAILKAVNADFEKLESETKSQETVDQESFNDQIRSEKIEKARRTKEIEMKGNRKMQKVDGITRMTASKKNVASEQEKAAQYLKDLEPACGAGDSSYEKRKAARKKEIEALEKAQGFLENPGDAAGAAAFLSKAQVHLQK